MVKAFKDREIAITRLLPGLSRGRRLPRSAVSHSHLRVSAAQLRAAMARAEAWLDEHGYVNSEHFVRVLSAARAGSSELRAALMMVGADQSRAASAILRELDAIPDEQQAGLARAPKLPFRYCDASALPVLRLQRLGVHVNARQSRDDLEAGPSALMECAA